MALISFWRGKDVFCPWLGAGRLMTGLAYHLPPGGFGVETGLSRNGWEQRIMREICLKSNHWLWKAWSGMERAGARRDKTHLSCCDYTFFITVGHPICFHRRLLRWDWSETSPFIDLHKHSESVVSADSGKRKGSSLLRRSRYTFYHTNLALPSFSTPRSIRPPFLN